MPLKDPLARKEYERKRYLIRGAEARRKAKERAVADPLYYRKGNIKSKYGLSLEGYRDMLTNQGGCCKICGTVEPGRFDHFDIDHCRDTGTIRGLLCQLCNKGLGMFKHDAGLLKKASCYLQQF